MLCSENEDEVNKYNLERSQAEKCYWELMLGVNKTASDYLDENEEILESE